MSSKKQSQRESPLKFNGDFGRKPQAEARRYVYGVLVSMLANERRQGRENGEGWMFGGIEREEDRRRLHKALEAVEKEMERKAYK